MGFGQPGPAGHELRAGNRADETLLEVSLHRSLLQGECKTGHFLQLSITNGNGMGLKSDATVLKKTKFFVIFEAFEQQ